MQIHRFGNLAAISVSGKGATRYITGEHARAAANHLARVADELERGVKFTDSKVGTFEAPDHESSYEAKRESNNAR